MLSLTLGAGQVSAQTSAAPATVTTVAPGVPATTQPISLELLPAGTVVLGDGRYLISNYGGLGIDIYIYSPTPLRIAAPSERTAFEANYADATGTRPPVPAAPTAAPPARSPPGPPSCRRFSRAAFKARPGRTRP
ncbi:hypothetical protein [Deinococcus multiflagellatus]|uniref:Uncharacterized protein n=1 Tax=Deinococcus multiflagellatus TaxID=1656887 RepID=A0ABW1ZTH2_9DEIO